MLLSRTQRILLLSGVGVAVLLLIGLIAVPHCESSAAPSPSPTPSATPSASPTNSPSPSPTARPSPTPQYRLPLVPDAGTASSPAPTSAPIAVPTADAPLREGRFDNDVRDFLAVGTRDGDTVAILLGRLAPPTLSVVAIPCETLDPGALTEAEQAEKNAEARRLSERIAERFGLRLSHSFTADLSCLDAMLDAVPTLSAVGMTFDESTVDAVLTASGTERAYGMGALGASICRLFSTVSPWTLPALRDATRGKVETELNVWELIGFCAALRGMTTTSVTVLPTETVENTLVLSPTADTVIKAMFR